MTRQRRTRDDEPVNRRSDLQSSIVSSHNIRDRLFPRSPNTDKFLRDLRIKEYKDYLLERTDEDIVLEDYIKPEGEYSDYTCSEFCGCHFIPVRDKRIVNRHHFHYRDSQNRIRWCCLTEPIADEELPTTEFSVLSSLLTEINWTLKTTYPKENSIFSTILLTEYTPKSFEPQQLSLQLQSLLVAREHFRQLVSTLHLRTYHYREFLYLQNLLTSRLKVAPDIAKLVLPSLKEPRFVTFPSSIAYFPYRTSSERVITFGIRDILGGVPPRFVSNGVFPSKFELWQLLFELIVYDREPKTYVALSYIHRLYKHLRELEIDTEARYREEDFFAAKQLAIITRCETEQVGNITELACYRKLV